MTDTYKLLDMIRLYPRSEYFKGWVFWIPILLTIVFASSLMFADSAIPIIGMTFDSLVSLSGVLLGILIGVMAIMVSVSTREFVGFLKMSLEGQPPLYDKVIFSFVWPTIWLSVSIFSSLLGKILIFSQDQIVLCITLALAGLSLWSGTYGIGNAVQAVLSVSYLARLRGDYVEAIMLQKDRQRANEPSHPESMGHQKRDPDLES